MSLGFRVPTLPIYPLIQEYKPFLIVVDLREPISSYVSLD